MRISRQSKSGFTLVEMLIVVAVIAVLIIVAIPIYNAQLEKSRAQVCLYNREVLLRQLYADTYLYPDETLDILELAGEHIEASHIVCPSGGTIIARGDAESFNVTCNKHSGKPIYNLANVLKNKGLGTLKNDDGDVWNSRIDYNGEGAFISKVKAILEESKISLGGNDINSWVAVRQGWNSDSPYTMYWSEIAMPPRNEEGAEDKVANMNAASSPEANDHGVPVVQYDDKTQKYSIGYMTVSARESNNNLLIYAYDAEARDVKNGFTQVGESYDDMTMLVRDYNELLDAYNEKMEALSH